MPREEVEDFTESHGLHALHLWHVQLCGVELVYGWPLRRRVLLQPEDKYEVMNQENVIEVKIKEDGEVKLYNSPQTNNPQLCGKLICVYSNINMLTFN